MDDALTGIPASLADLDRFLNERNRHGRNECRGSYCPGQEVLDSDEPMPLLRVLVETMPIILWTIDASGIIRMCEGKALEGLGLKPGEAVGASIFELFKEYPEAIAAVRRMLSGEHFVVPVEVAPHHYEVHCIPVRSPEGTVSGGVGISLEVTRQRHAELKTIEQERLFETIFAFLPHALVLATPERIIERINPAAEALFGYEEKELRGISTKILYADNARFEETDAIITGSTAPLVTEIKLRRKNGSTFISEFIFTKLLDPNGAVRWFLGKHRDVTEERQKRSLLQWHEEALQAMIDAAPNFALLVNREGTVLLANRKVADYLHLPLEQLIGKNTADIYKDPNICRSRNAHIKTALDSGTAVDFVDTRNGRWFEHHISPLPDASGGYARAAITILDITDRVKLEEEEREQIAKELHDVVSEMLETVHDEHSMHDHLHGRSLTPREREVLKEIASGLSTKMIAHKFGVSTKTVESQRLSIMRKLRLFNVVDLTKYALREGLVSLNE